MRNPLVYLGIIAAVLFLTLLLRPQRATESPAAPQPTMEKLTITSSAFAHNTSIPARYTCDGDDVNPPLMISGVPQSAKRIALIMDDPDAPRGTIRPGSGQAWVHWVAWNIDPQKTAIEENVRALGIEGTTSFGKPGYGGPCPPFNPDASVGAGTHRYFFKFYALDTLLKLPQSTTKTDLEKAMEEHILAQGELIGLYRRTK